MLYAKHSGKTFAWRIRIAHEAINGILNLDDKLMIVSTDKQVTKTVREWLMEWYPDVFSKEAQNAKQ